MYISQRSELLNTLHTHVSNVSRTLLEAFTTEEAFTEDSAAIMTTEEAFTKDSAAIMTDHHDAHRHDAHHRDDRHHNRHHNHRSQN